MTPYDPDPLHVEPDPRDRYVWIVRRRQPWHYQREHRRRLAAGFLFAVFVAVLIVVVWK